MQRAPAARWPERGATTGALLVRAASLEEAAALFTHARADAAVQPAAVLLLLWGRRGVQEWRRKQRCCTYRAR